MVALNPKITHPYDYQAEGIDQIRHEMAHGNRRVLYQLGTGGGKTAVFGFIAKYVSQKNKPVMVLVHRDNLSRQASASLDDIGVPHGIVKRGRSFQPYLTQVCSVGTLIRRLDKLPFEPYMIIIDETHHIAKGNQWARIVEKFPNVLVLGVTATPCRLDGKGLNDFFDVMIQGPPVLDLIARGKITPLKQYEPEVFDRSHFHMLGGDFKKDEVNLAMDKKSVVGSAVSHYQKICPGARTLVFAPSIAIAVKVAKAFNDADIRAEVITGKMSSDQQWRLIEALKKKEILILVTVDVVSEGTDIPAVEAGIMMRPTASLVIYLQQVGRIMRAFEGKEFGYLIDMVGNIDEHGPYWLEREWNLNGMPKKRKGEKEAIPRLYRCVECFYKFQLSDAKKITDILGKEIDVCPCCDTPVMSTGRSIQEIEGELKEIDDRRAAELEAKFQRKKEEGSARTLAELYVLANKCGHKWKWAEYKFEARMKRKIMPDERRSEMRKAYAIIDTIRS